jgi:broad specificity phosphatase PhoE
MDIRRTRLALLLPVLVLLSLACAGNGPGAGAPASDAGSVQTSDSMLVGGTVYLVRHAETVGGDGDDRYLGEAGRARAEALADMLEEVGIQRVYSTDYRRTRETAAPIAGRLGLEVEPYDPRDLAGFAEELLSLGQVVLVVGHSNTTPELVEHLGGVPGAPIDEPTEHDRLYRVELPSGETVVTRYGE